MKEMDVSEVFLWNFPQDLREGYLPKNCMVRYQVTPRVSDIINKSVGRLSWMKEIDFGD